MSYVPPHQTDGSLNELFSRLITFTGYKDNLLRADTQQGFLVWFDKLQKIDRRTLFIFIRQNLTSFPLAWLRPVNDFFWQIGEPIVPYELINLDKEKLTEEDLKGVKGFRDFKGLLNQDNKGDD